MFEKISLKHHIYQLITDQPIDYTLEYVAGNLAK